ncbi:MAG: GtrA family protein [Bacteroidales bacterium]
MKKLNNKIVGLIRDLILSIINRAYNPFRQLIPPETFRYAATGGFNTAFDIILYFVFYNFILNKQIIDLGFVSISPHIAAFLFVFPVTFTTGFLLAKYITFTGSTIRGRVQFSRYAMMVGGSIFLNYVLLKLFVEYFHIWPTVSKVIITVIVVIYSYVVQRYFTFRTGMIKKGKRVV